MKNFQKTDELMMKFQNSRIEKVKLDKITGGKLIKTGGQLTSDVQTGVTSGGSHDNNNTFSDRDDYYNGTL
jgi:hypothetical protein